MIGIKEAVQRLVGLEKGIHIDGLQETPDAIPDFEFSQVWDEIETAAKDDIEVAMEIFRLGTDDEFAALVNLADFFMVMSKINPETCEVMRLAKSRNSEKIMNATRTGFGKFFDMFYNDPSTSP